MNLSNEETHQDPQDYFQEAFGGSVPDALYEEFCDGPAGDGVSFAEFAAQAQKRREELFEALSQPLETPTEQQAEPKQFEF